MAGFRTFLTLTTLLLLAAPGLAAVPRVETHSYAPDNHVRQVCPLHGATNGCFLLEGDETTVTVRVVDASGLPTHVHYSFETEEAGWIEAGTFCGEATLTVPAGSVWLDIFPSPVAMVAEPALCNPVATLGTITASFV